MVTTCLGYIHEFLTLCIKKKLPVYGSFFHRENQHLSIIINIIEGKAGIITAQKSGTGIVVKRTIIYRSGCA
jgi:hypothetical protein